VSLVLQGDVLFDSSEIIAQMQLSGRLNAAKDAFASRCSGHGDSSLECLALAPRVRSFCGAHSRSECETFSYSADSSSCKGVRCPGLCSFVHESVTRQRNRLEGVRGYPYHFPNHGCQSEDIATESPRSLGLPVSQIPMQGGTVNHPDHHHTTHSTTSQDVP